MTEVQAEMNAQLAVAIDIVGVGKSYPLYKNSMERFFHTASLGRSRSPAYHHALQKINLQVPAGKLTAIIGENGSGKSTLLQIMAGTLQPTTGSVQKYGKLAALLELGAGFEPDATGRENAYTSCLLHGISKSEAMALVPKMLAFAEIGDFADQPTKLYSSGMFVRLAYAVVAHVDADILVVDEALAVGDAYFQQKCMRHMHDYMSRGTIVLVTHDMTAVKSLAQHVIWLHKGEVLESGDPKTIADAFLKAQYAKHQAVNAPLAAVAIPSAASLEKAIDLRLEPAETKHLVQNTLRAVQSKEQRAYGEGRATIQSVELLDQQGLATHVVHGATSMQIRIRAQVHQRLGSPIIGFILKNRLGIAVFGDNTYGQVLTYEPAVEDVAGGTGANSGEVIEATFAFVLPFLPAAEYSLSVAIADGSLKDHKQQHWVDEALILQSDGTAVHGELIGVPMQRITLVVQR